MKLIKVKLKPSYKIAITDSFRELPRLLMELRLGRNGCCVTNARLRRLFGPQLKGALETIGAKLNFLLIPDSERSKSVSQSLKVIEALLRYDKKERPFIVALGGGVAGDLAGYVASIYKRGIPYIQVPTTLLSQVDSSIGGKVAIDLPCAKNLIGSFYQPRLVYINTQTLRSLPLRQLRNGLAEVLKYGVIKDEGLFKFLEVNYKKAISRDKRILEHLIFRSAEIKSHLVELDERDERMKRIILNFGHTIGHAIEQAAGYSKKVYHGEAISVGMVIASSISVKLGLLKDEIAGRIKTLFTNIGLPVVLKGVSRSSIMKASGFDKKFIHGTNRFVLPVAIGRVVVREAVPSSVILSAIEENIEA